MANEFVREWAYGNWKAGSPTGDRRWVVGDECRWSSTYHLSPITCHLAPTHEASNLSMPTLLARQELRLTTNRAMFSRRGVKRPESESAVQPALTSASARRVAPSTPRSAG